MPTAGNLERGLTSLIETLGGAGVESPAARRALAAAEQVGVDDPELAEAYIRNARSLFGVATVLVADVADKDMVGDVCCCALARVYVERRRNTAVTDCTERLHAAVFAEARRISGFSSLS